MFCHDESFPEVENIQDNSRKDDESFREEIYISFREEIYYLHKVISI